MSHNFHEGSLKDSLIRDTNNQHTLQQEMSYSHQLDDSELVCKYSSGLLWPSKAFIIVISWGNSDFLRSKGLSFGFFLLIWKHKQNIYYPSVTLKTMIFFCVGGNMLHQLNSSTYNPAITITDTCEEKQLKMQQTHARTLYFK